MKLVWRRAVEARGLLLAAAIAALVAVALVTGLSDYNRRAVDAGQRALLAAAPAEERSLLVSGSGGRDAEEYADRDRAVRAQFTDGLGGVPVTVAAARYGTGRELTGDLGAARVGDDPMFATLGTLADLPAHAELTSGTWPAPGSTPLQVTLPEKVAGLLGLRTGDRVPLFDRSSERAGEVRIAGTWRPRDPAEAYWRLAPGVGEGDGGDASYGPFALDPADFARTFPGSSSASWLVEPNLGTVEPSRLASVKGAVAAISEKIPEATGLGSSAQSVTSMDRLIDRLGRADLVGRSALLTPLLLIVVLGGYALVLVAALLNEDRRPQTALLRARG
ncbi:ABC transporter permease, partial [Micromonospora globispora]